MKSPQINVRILIAAIFISGLFISEAFIYALYANPQTDKPALAPFFLKVFAVYSGPLGVVLAKVFREGEYRPPGVIGQATLAVLLVAVWNVVVFLAIRAELLQSNWTASQVELDSISIAISFLITGLLSFYFDATAKTQDSGDAGARP